MYNNNVVQLKDSFQALSIDSVWVNPRKRKLCQILINSNFYDVYEYDMSDWLLIEALQKSDNGKNAITTMEMLKIAVPHCPIDDLLELTQVEVADILAMVMATINTSDEYDQKNINMKH